MAQGCSKLEQKVSGWKRFVAKGVLCTGLALSIMGCNGGGGSGGSDKPEDKTPPSLTSTIPPYSYEGYGLPIEAIAKDDENGTEVFYDQRDEGTETWTETKMTYIGGDKWRDVTFLPSGKYVLRTRARDTSPNHNQSVSAISSSRIYANESSARSIIESKLQEYKSNGEIAEHLMQPIIEGEEEEIRADEAIIDNDGIYQIIDYEGENLEDYEAKRAKLSKVGMGYIRIGPHVKNELPAVMENIRANGFQSGNYQETK